MLLDRIVGMLLSLLVGLLLLGAVSGCASTAQPPPTMAAPGPVPAAGLFGDLLLDLLLLGLGAGL